VIARHVEEDTMPRIPVCAAVLTAAGQSLRIETLLLDEPRTGEVLVRTAASGLCHSDLHYLTGVLDIPTPAVLGHEVAGVVESVGDGVRRVKAGDRVVVTITPSCGQCASCVSGYATRCERVSELRKRSEPLLTDTAGNAVTSLGAIGAFAEAVVVPESALAVVGDLDPIGACLLGCCISTGVGAVMHGAAVSPADTVAVIGCGGVGMAIIQGARISGASRIIALDVSPGKLELARVLGASDVLNPTVDNARDAVLSIVPGGVTRSFEAVGRPETAELAFSLLAPGGVATVLGLMPPGSRIGLDAVALIEGDRRIQGAYMGSNRFLADLGPLLEHCRRGSFDLDAMVTSVIDLERINEGFAAMRGPSSIRTVVSFAEGIAA
jgi:alcohol dehydrogenase/S-(hydroxymethyl)glutathione dehydrogenase/alcohol dehydrogenase